MELRHFTSLLKITPNGYIFK